MIRLAFVFLFQLNRGAFRSTLTLRAFPLEIVAPIRAISVSAMLTFQFADGLTVIRSSLPRVANDFLAVGIHEASSRCASVMRHARPLSSAVLVAWAGYCGRRCGPHGFAPKEHSLVRRLGLGVPAFPQMRA